MGRDMIFYGTSAAEGIPDPFCTCYLCRNAREKGGKDIRSRSMFRLNEEVSIDLGADSFLQAVKYGDFVNLRHVLVTHTHEDHFAYMMMGVRKMATHRIESPLHYYLTDQAYEIVDFYRNHVPILKGTLKELEQDGIICFHRQEFQKPFEINGMKVLAFKGNHFGNMGEHCANYLIWLPDGKTLFYGLDTGYYLEEVFEELKQYHIDYLISECTFGNADDRGEKPHGHLDIASCQLVFERLLKQGTITSRSHIYLTHINHCHTADHETMQRIFDQAGFSVPVTVAYDGMQIPPLR